MSVARALAVGNEVAHAQGTEPADSLVTISEDTSTRAVFGASITRHEITSTAGGNLIVLVDETSGAVQRVIRGQ